MSHELKDLADSHDLSALGPIGHDLGMHPELKPMYDATMRTIQKTDPSFYGQIVGRLQKMPTGIDLVAEAETILNTLKGISGGSGS